MHTTRGEARAHQRPELNTDQVRVEHWNNPHASSLVTPGTVAGRLLMEREEQSLHVTDPSKTTQPHKRRLALPCPLEKKGSKVLVPTMSMEGQKGLVKGQKGQGQFLIGQGSASDI